MDVIPHGSSTKVDVKIGVATAHGHEAVLLDFRVLHRGEIVGGIFVGRLQYWGPNRVDPVQLE